MLTIFHVPISSLSYKETIGKLKKMMESSFSHHIITANPETLMKAQKSEMMLNVLNLADMVVPDGVGIVWASKFFGRPLRERVTGFDLATELIEYAVQKNLRVFLLGSTSSRNQSAIERLKKQYPSLQIEGHHGFFKSNEENKIVEIIKSYNPSLLLVGMGMPKQEFFISKNKEQLNIPLMMGVGGAIDVFSGFVKRAPLFWRQSNLEWLYRLLSQPKRIKRQLIIPQFIFKVYKEKQQKNIKK